MGIKTTKVWLVAVVLLPWCAASLCPQGVEYWDTETESCVNCSRCDPAAKQVVIRPCQAHTDTVCGPISDLDIDWSWMKRDEKPNNKHHDKHHGKKAHKHIIDLSDDIDINPQHHRDLPLLGDEVETMRPASKHHGGHKHHKHDDGLGLEKKPNRKHHLSSESLLSEDFEPLNDHKKKQRLPPPPPLKSTDDLEREWKEWLIQSQNRLQHRKDDLLKNLHKESPYNEKHHFKLNRPHGNIFEDEPLGDLGHHGSTHHKDHNHFSPLDLDIFNKLLSHEHQKQEEEKLSLSHLLSEENKLQDRRREEHTRERGNDLSYPMDSFDFRSVLPTHRLFLGEPSTVSEIMDQDFAEESEDGEDERLKEDKEPSVVAVPFTAAERLVWDWQAVALASAVAACLLFFGVVGVYSLLHARQWRRLKTNLDTDMEELSVKVGLMGGVGASAADAANTNLYLENLLGNKKKNSNIYTQKRPLS